MTDQNQHDQNQHDQDHAASEPEEHTTAAEDQQQAPHHHDEARNEARSEDSEKQAPQQDSGENSTEPDDTASGGEDNSTGSSSGGDGETSETDPTEQTPPTGTQSPGSLFGSEEMEDMKSEEVKTKEAEAKKRKEAASKSASSGKTYPAGTELRYSGHSKELPEEMSESQILKWAADDFPELKEGNFTLRYDSTKGRLVPIPPAQKKGAFAKGAFAENPAVADTAGPQCYEVRTSPPEGEKPPVYRLLCADGVYEVRTNLSGTYVARIDSGLTLAEGYYPSVPKAPASLLAGIVRIFKERPDTEALIDLVYDRRDGAFRLIWNQKQATAGSVDYQPLPDDDNIVLYAEIHSHHRMGSWFSPTDDAAEVKTGVYGVVGRISDDVPEARFRYSCGGHFRELLAEDLFDDPSLVAATVKRPTR